MAMRTADGYIYRDGGFVQAHAFEEDGWRIRYGPYEGKADISGVLTTGLVNCHTHCADAGVKVVEGMSLMDLVAPPDGLKHRYLRETPRNVLVDDMRRFSKRSRSFGNTTFIDFREGGVEGCRMAREAFSDGIVLGRPVSKEFDATEVEAILDIADGIALPSLTDTGKDYAEKCADLAKKAGKPFAIHVSERIREDIETVLTFDPAFVVHMVEATDRDLRLCRDNDVPIVICPRSNRFFGKTTPVKRMVQADVDLALGTDNAMLCSPDLRPEAALMSDLSGECEPPYAVWKALFDGGKKLLYRKIKIGKAVEDHADAVLPCPEGSPGKVLGTYGEVQVLK
ncbi:MAG: amidohydrolase family protein [archaeon]|nr:amidohydrolase family protein [archaeon]